MLFLPQPKEDIRRLATDTIRAVLINVKKQISNKGNDKTPEQDHFREVARKIVKQVLEGVSQRLKVRRKLSFSFKIFKFTFCYKLFGFLVMQLMNVYKNKTLRIHQAVHGDDSPIE